MTNPLRVDLSSENVGKGLGSLVLAILDVVRQLLERQVLHRMDADSLTPDQIERLGFALLALDERFAELREIFGVGDNPAVSVGAAPNPFPDGPQDSNGLDWFKPAEEG